jgi:hypothetical protein
VCSSDLVLPLLPPVDLVLTDPPYGIGASAGTGKYGRLKVEAGRDLEWDNNTPPQWLMLLMFLPLVGAIILIIFFCQDSQPGENQYGPNPKALPVTI